MYTTTSGIIGSNTINAYQSNTTYTVANQIKSRTTRIAEFKVPTINTQYGEKNMLTGKVSGENAPHSWYLNRLNNLATAYKQKLNVYSGFRTVELQRQLFNDSDKSGKMVASPGNSRHNAGLAVDCDSQWVKDLSNKELAKYGLYKPMDYENWHIEPIETKGKSTESIIAQYGIPASYASVSTVYFMWQE